MTSAQMRAARAMLDWTQPDLAKAAGVSVETIKRLERLEGEVKATRVATIDAIEAALIKAGIEFTNGDAQGVRMKPKKKR